ncbi:hypothetical protein BDP27DRAFT_1440854 [Rhodocollybia butyracea]|uniref:WH1 domain-containing protein n=1 Tax=Rhodocollybia butyracea TaxID=206335 RepID=A0A9P5UH22_9AGAR|nr:hypothetical protein BDP27DRAFT_1440854 [Rhodocollybia butyracea]
MPIIRQFSVTHSAMCSSSHAERTICQVTGRLYHAKFAAMEHDWQYFNQRGTIVFGQTPSDGVKAAQSTADLEDGSHWKGPEIVADANYWFSLQDESGRNLWMFQIPPDFAYRIDKPFFHVFNGRSRMWGFLFDSDQDGQNFGEFVRAHIPSPPHVKQDGQLARKVYKSISTRTSREPSIRSKISLKSRILRDHNTSTPTLVPSSQGEAFPEYRPRQNIKGITTSMISLPETQTFVHVGHIGFDCNGAIECSGGVDPSWSNAITHLETRQKAGETSSMPADKDLTGSRRSGIAGFGLAGIHAGCF